MLPVPGPTVLYLCTGNYYRSRFAEILTNDLGIRARSRGLALSPLNQGPISNLTLTGLEDRSIRSPGVRRFPIRLATQDLLAADLIVAVDRREHQPMLAARFPDWVDRVRYWDVADVGDEDPTTALARLEAGATKLVTELKRAPTAAAGGASPRR